MGRKEKKMNEKKKGQLCRVWRVEYGGNYMYT